MQSKTSCFNKTLFRKHVTRFWPVWAAYLVIWLLDMPVGLLSQRATYLSDPTTYSVQYMQQSVLNSVHVGVVMSFIFSVLMAMAVWSFLYNARSASAAACLPVTRKAQFGSAVLAGLLPLAAAHVVTFLLTALAEASMGLLHLPTLLTWLGVTLLNLLFFYGFATLCAMLTGNIIILPAVYVVLSFLGAGLLVLLNGIADYFLYGLSGFAGEWLLWLSPAVKLFTAQIHTSISAYDAARDAWVTVGWQFQGWLVAGIYAVVGVGLLFAARALLLRRKMESAGDVVAVPVLKPVFRWCMGLCAGLCFAEMMLYVFDLAGETQRMIFASTALWLVIGAFLGWFIAEMLLRRSFKVFKGGWRGFGGWALCCVVLLAALTATELDVLGVERRQPAAEKIESVMVRCEGEYAWLESPEGIAEAKALHRSVIDHKAQQDQCSSKTFFRHEESGAYQTADFYIDYYLTNGGHLKRSYSLPHRYDDVSDDAYAAQALLNCPEAVLARKEVPEEFTAETVYYGNISAVMPATECAAAAGYDDPANYVLVELAGLTKAQAEALDGDARNAQLRETLADWRWMDDAMYEIGRYESVYLEKYGSYIEIPAIPEVGGEIDWDRIWLNYTLDLTRQEAWELYETCVRPDVAANALGRVWVLQGSDYAATVYAANVEIGARWPTEDGRSQTAEIEPEYSSYIPATDSGMYHYSFSTAPTVNSARTNAWFEAHGLHLYTGGEVRAAQAK